MNHTMHARLRAGDPDAFRELFDSYAGLVYGYAARATGDRSLAEDVVSLCFLEAWRLRDRLRDEGETPRPWLMGIAVNVLRNTARAKRRHERAMARLPPPPTEPDFSDEVAGRLADAEQLAAVKRALDRLPERERQTFMLHVWSGLSYAETAEALGVRLGTVRSRLSRTRKRLRGLADEELRIGARRRGEVPEEHREPTRRRGQQPGDRRLMAVRSIEENRP
ncbi:RNA polymerase sigma factor [Streptomyces sp. DSM 44915]|uniref:RNA polymerase sigma factor n=1 Tax=Streptomyces chisholmiae TaxID=3075540 RepID=A0ABU2JTD3_9ACTN|nr:RNA polymerase sigma factor [Streptomyces sp. DSM 44915]MDT0268177.1 RNA polymerase sigma factor [Streptomyces sp. DSM 44915]